MGIMPSDRDEKWQEIFRKYGLSGSQPGKDADPSADNRERLRNGRTPITVDRTRPQQDKRDR